MGGGPAGAAAALTLLAHTSLSVTVVEREGYAGPRIGESLAPGARRLLEYLGAWERFEARGHAPARATAAAWGDDQLLTRHFVFGVDGPGWHLDRRAFDEDLADLVRERGGRMVDASVAGIRRGGNGRWRVAARAGRSRFVLDAGRILDATGRRAAVARRLAPHAAAADDRLVAVARTYRLAAPAEPATIVESDPGGWWYSAALPGSRAVVVRLSDGDLLRAQRVRERRAWEQELAATKHVRPRVGGAVEDGGPLIRPAFSRVLDRPAGGGWVAAGEAAVSFDPLSSMGIGHALASGIEAARVIDAMAGAGAEAAAGYARAVRRQYEAYRARQLAYYALERRWPSSEFWSRRAAGPAMHP